MPLEIADAPAPQPRCGCAPAEHAAARRCAAHGPLGGAGRCAMRCWARRPSTAQARRAGASVSTTVGAAGAPPSSGKPAARGAARRRRRWRRHRASNSVSTAPVLGTSPRHHTSKHGPHRARLDLSGDDDHGRVGQRRRNARCAVHAVHAGHRRVDQRQIEGLFVQACQQLVAVARLDGVQRRSTTASARASASRAPADDRRRSTPSMTALPGARQRPGSANSAGAPREPAL